MTTWAERKEEQSLSLLRNNDNLGRAERGAEPISAKEKCVITESLKAVVSCVTSYVLNSPVEK
jgi:hypothetical protein